MPWRFLPYLPLLSLLAAGCVALPRAWAMRRRGVSVISIDWRRPVGERTFAALFVAVLVFWFYLVIAEIGWLPMNSLPAWLAGRIVDGPIARSVGALLLIAWPVIYALGVFALADSWRLGSDHDRPAPLVTSGIFCWSRNPVYLGFNLLFWGTALVHGRAVHVLLAVALSLLLHAVVLREEQALAARFGDEFDQYRRRIGRYASRWPGGKQ